MALAGFKNYLYALCQLYKIPPSLSIIKRKHRKLKAANTNTRDEFSSFKTCIWQMKMTSKTFVYYIIGVIFVFAKSRSSRTSVVDRSSATRRHFHADHIKQSHRLHHERCVCWNHLCQWHFRIYGVAKCNLLLSERLHHFLIWLF